MNNSWTLPAPAKLNLFLHILGRRADGYHQLETVFQILDWGDCLHFEQAEDISVCQQPDGGIAEQQNLVYRAAKLLADHSHCHKGIRIRLEKRIPTGAGLGGGSSDAATTLLALNRIWQLNLSTDRLAELGLKLGADVPVFIKGESAFATGIGEQLTPIDTPNSWFLVFTPPIHVSTESIFSNPQLTRDSRPIKMCALAAPEGRNDCQAVVEMLYAGVAKSRKVLEKFCPVKMSGTGSSLFAEFEQKADAEQVLANLTDENLGDYSAFIAQGVSQSRVHAAVSRISDR